MTQRCSPARTAGPAVTVVPSRSRSKEPRPGCWGEQWSAAAPSGLPAGPLLQRRGPHCLTDTRMEPKGAPAAWLPLFQTQPPSPHLSGGPHLSLHEKESGEITTRIPNPTTEKYLKEFPSKTGRAGRGQVRTELAPRGWETEESSRERRASSHLFCLHWKREGLSG